MALFIASPVPVNAGGVPAATLEGLEVTHKKGVSRIPTPFFGMRMRPEFPKRYEQLEKLCGMK